MTIFPSFTESIYINALPHLHLYYISSVSTIFTFKSSIRANATTKLSDATHDLVQQADDMDVTASRKAQLYRAL